MCTTRTGGALIYGERIITSRRIAKHIETCAEEFIARLAPGPGDRLLDVACGSGNLAIPAARSARRATRRARYGYRVEVT